MELSECGMVQLMTADFEVPLFAIERIGGIVVKTSDSFHSGLATTHWSREPYGVSTGDLRPSFMQTALVKEHHFELSNVMFFDIARVVRAASGQDRESHAGEEDHGPQPGPRGECGIVRTGVHSSLGMGFLRHHEA